VELWVSRSAMGEFSMARVPVLLLPSGGPRPDLDRLDLDLGQHDLDPGLPHAAWSVRASLVDRWAASILRKACVWVEQGGAGDWGNDEAR
jgi:hypothetical protein